MNKFYVKFVPWNEKTLSSIINKTIKFSTVYEFNDFNEYGYVGCPTANVDLESKITDLSFLNNLLTLSAERCNEEYSNKIARFLKEGKAQQLLDPKENCLHLLNEALAYSSVGIFCLADIDVFKDDSAQLMFAHYSQNLKGLALIYEVDNTPPEKVIYNSSNKIGDNKILYNWCRGSYKDMSNFLCKSAKWNYEKERRVFGKPGIVLAEEHNLTLKAILYTRRFHGEKEVLSNINNYLYNRGLVIERIFASSTEPIFIMEKGHTNCFHFLNLTFCNTHQLHNFTIRHLELSDIETIVALSKSKRLDYEKAQPQFWKYAGEGGDNAQKEWFKELLEDKNYLMFTATRHCEQSEAIQENNTGSPRLTPRDDEEILGFIIGKIMPTPEVYNPSGLTVMIDDFCVKSENLWKSAGKQLVEAIKKEGKAKGAAQILVVCGAHDTPKRKFLMNQNLSIASEWFVGGIT